MMVYIREAESQDFPFILNLMKNELGYPSLNETDALKRLEYLHYNSLRKLIALN